MRFEESAKVMYNAAEVIPHMPNALKPHSLALKFPRLAPDQYEAMKEDIRVTVGKTLNVAVGLIPLVLFGVLAIGIGNTNGPVVRFGIFFAVLVAGFIAFRVAYGPSKPPRKSDTPSPT